MNEIRAIQTEYRGYLFRSRLEVRWAVFFDACGVDWEYEPEGYDLGNGLYYLPDFLLHGVTINHGYFKKNCDIYVEVKGQMNDADAEKINRFYAAGYPEGNDWGVSHTAVLVVGNIPDGEDMCEILDNLQTEAYHDHHGWPNLYNFETVDGDYFGAYPGVDKHGKFNLFGDDSTYLWSMNSDVTERAYRLARQARFREFGFIKIDMIITKSISRFSRNTVDCLKYTRQLKELNIAVFFEKENINTLDAKGEVLMTIMAALAQQESESLSANVRLGIQFRNQQGKVQINHNWFLGYTKDEDGKLVIVPEEAAVVRRIYAEYLEGASFLQIKRSLEADGIQNGAKHDKWYESNIKQILTNEKYIGDALLQKTYTTDFLNKTRVKNNGLVPQYYVEGDHEAIIPKDIYLQVQEELVRRRVVKTSANGKKRSYSCNHCFSQIVICGECGEMFRRLHWNNRGVKSIVWRCISRLESTGLECHARTINELVLQDVVVKAINQMPGDKSNYQAQLQLNIAAVIRASQATAIDSIDKKLMALQQELIQKTNSKEDYDEIADEIFRLRELRQKTTVDTAARDEQIKRINDL